MSLLDDKVALITGAARGQGRAAAERFVAEGARVLLTDLLDAEGRAAAAALGDAASYCHLDVTDTAQWSDAVESARQLFGRLDILVNNAGVFLPTSLDDGDDGVFRQVLHVNLVGPFLGTRAALPALRERGGAIVNVASVAGIRAVPGGAAYASSKFGLRGLTKVTALELAPHGIRANAVLPGVVRTAMVDAVLAAREDQVLTGIPLARVGEPTDLASAVAWLASDESSWITGADLVVDGGATAILRT